MICVLMLIIFILEVLLFLSMCKLEEKIKILENKMRRLNR